MIPSLTGSLAGTKFESLLGDVGQDGLFILWLSVMSKLMFPCLTGKKLESLFGYVGQYALFIFIVKCNNGAVVPQPNWYED